VVDLQPLIRSGIGFAKLLLMRLPAALAVFAAGLALLVLDHNGIGGLMMIAGVIAAGLVLGFTAFSARPRP
jgi:hypothetical protein